MLALFDALQFVDRVDVAEAIAKQSDNQGEDPKFYIYVNTSRERQKSGGTPAETAKLIRYCREKCDLDVTGLICIPTEGEHTADFALLGEITRAEGLNTLSMGMSSAECDGANAGIKARRWLGCNLYRTMRRALL
ncbi:hypothetical protein BUMB_04283 [Candidatus Paraburkholderia calva]|nr:hypothetical protein BUMB_04283 [Candidatus Paraburkholderia calva]